MKILISSNEKIINENTNEVVGIRACDVVETPFEVHPSLFWVDCPDGVDGTTHCYNADTQQFVLLPPPKLEAQPVSQGAQPVSQGAQTL